jgi:hypothetical protein
MEDLKADIDNADYSSFVSHSENTLDSSINKELLYYASMRNTLDIFEYILGTRMSLTTLTSESEIRLGVVAMLFAAKYGSLDVLQYLIEEKSISAEARSGEALILACRYCHQNIVEYLISINVDVNVQSGEPLVQCCIRNYLDLAQLLVENGATVTINSNTPIITALQYGNNDVVNYLKDQGGNLLDQSEKAITISVIYDILNEV